MGPELILAADACATESAALVVQIVKTAAKVVKLKRKCKILAREAMLLKTLLENNRSAIDSFQTLERILKCFEAIKDFVAACQNYNVGEQILEVVFMGTFPRLRKECRALRELFCFESIVQLLSRQEDGGKVIADAHNKLLQGQKTQTEVLQELYRKQENLQNSLARGRPLFGAVKLSGLSHDVVPGEQFQWSSNRSSGCGTLEGVGEVQCLPLAVRTATNLYLDIYKDVQSAAYVRRLFGVLLDQGQYFAILETTNDKTTLAEWCKLNAGKDTLSGLRLAFNICKSIAWLHKAELLVKTLNDHNILVQNGNGEGIRPLLTDLENSRHFLQRTAGDAYDVRYEAPEYQSTGQHSVYTDIWLLGILVWQCVSGCIPFGTLDKEVSPESPPAQELREQLRKFKSGSAKGPLAESSASSSDIVRSLYNLCRQCCNPESLLRPTSAAVAQRLQDLLITASDPAVSAPGGTSTVDVIETHADTLHDEEAQIRTSSIEAVLLREIRSARSKNSSGKTVPHEPNPPISSEDFASYVHDELEYDQARLPTKSFLIGAALWWQLVPGYSVRVPNDDVPNQLMVGEGYRRAKACLEYLEYAAMSGYKEAYFEISRAHASLYHLHKDAYEQLQKKIGISSLAADG